MADRSSGSTACCSGKLPQGCVLAVAFVGLLMLAWWLPLPEGLQVTLGCFVLLGALANAAGFVESQQEDEPVVRTPLHRKPKLNRPTVTCRQ